MKNQHLILFVACLALVFSPYWVYVGISPLLYIKDLSVSLEHFGIYQGSFALTFGLGSLFFGYIISRRGQQQWIRAAVATFTIGIICIALAVFSGTKNPLLITLAFMPYNLGIIFPSVILYPLCLQIMPASKGRISSLLQITKLVCTSLSLQTVGYLYDHSFFSIGIMLITLIMAATILLSVVLNKMPTT